MIRSAAPQANWIRRLICVFCLMLLATQGYADASRFAGRYVGSADVIDADGTSTARDMSVEIKATDDDKFTVDWTSTTYRPDGTTKSKSYSINFAETNRDGIYAAAMRRDVFGNDVQLDPMKGEPYVWGRIIGDTLTVYSLTINSEGGYDLQQFDRTLADDGLKLTFQSIHDGEISRSVSTLLKRQ